MKRVLSAAVVFLMCMLCMCAASAEATRIMVASDVHYISPSLYAGSELFLWAIAQGDGKASHYSGELLEGLVAEARHQQPDLLIITGDLTFNGERVSHEEMAAALRPLTEEGIPIAVIPGNHDINMRPVHYLPDGYERTEGVDSAAFREIWQGMLADEITGPGFCGMKRASDKVWVAMGDYGMYEIYTMPNGLALPEHMDWMNGLLAQAKEEGMHVVSASHQSMIAHTSFSADSFRVWQGEEIVASLKEAGCRLNLSGHMHLQHILNLDGGMADIATGAWAVSPHRYGIVEVQEDGSVSYQAYSLCEEHVGAETLVATSAFFKKICADKERPELEGFGLPPETVETMLDYCVKVNVAYFDGSLAHHPELMTDPAAAMWAEVAEQSFFGAYITNLLSEPVEEALAWEYMAN